jgi:prefoldin subunit 5
MCSFVTDCLDISKLTEEEKTCLEKYLQGRRDELQAKINDLQSRIAKVSQAVQTLRPRR